MMRPSLLRAHQRQRDGDALRRGGEVAVDHQLGVFRGQLVPMPVVDVDPGVVEEDVEAADRVADVARRCGAPRRARSGRRAGHGRCRPAARMRAATPSSGSRRRPVSTIAAPSSASISAAASPMPLPPPVTQTTFPLRLRHRPSPQLASAEAILVGVVIASGATQSRSSQLTRPEIASSPELSQDR